MSIEEYFYSYISDIPNSKSTILQKHMFISEDDITQYNITT